MNKDTHKEPGKRGPKPRNPDGLADITVRQFPTDLRHKARLAAFTRNITLREFVIEAVTEKLDATQRLH